MTPIPSLAEEVSLWRAGHGVVAGLDEVGRGAWAGPIVAAAVVLPPCEEVPEPLRRVRDSKALSPAAREELLDVVLAEALAVGVGMMPPELIDHVGIAGANRLAMMAALDNLGCPVDYLLIDYCRLPALATPQKALVDGDALCLSIAAASVVAKVTRDRLMRDLAQTYPGYGWEHNVGYGTKEHQTALVRLGLTPQHRRSFAPMKDLVHGALPARDLPLAVEQSIVTAHA